MYPCFIQSRKRREMFGHERNITSVLVPRFSSWRVMVIPKAEFWQSEYAAEESLAARWSSAKSAAEAVFLLSERVLGTKSTE